MAIAGIRELQSHLSRYLDRVRAGEEIIVTDRGRAVARALPIDGERTIDRLIREGRVHAGETAEAESPHAARDRGHRVRRHRRTAALIAYFDTSGIVPLLVDEGGTIAARG